MDYAFNVGFVAMAPTSYMCWDQVSQRGKRIDKNDEKNFQLLTMGLCLPLISIVVIWSLDLKVTSVSHMMNVTN